MATNSNQQNKSTADIKLHAEANINLTFKRNLTRKDPRTGKSNFPTLSKTIVNRNYSIPKRKNSNYKGRNDKTSK